MNEAATIPLFNLRLIRGQNLYDNQFSLLVMSNYNGSNSSASLNYTSGLRQLQLSSLTGKHTYCPQTLEKQGSRLRHATGGRFQGSESRTSQ